MSAYPPPLPGPVLPLLLVLPGACTLGVVADGSGLVVRSGVDFGDVPGRTKTATKLKNEAMLRQVCDDAKGASLIHASHAIEILSSLRSKSVKQVSGFRGNLEVTPELGIPVWCYTKTTEQRLPSLSKLSVPAMDAGGATCKVWYRTCARRGASPAFFATLFVTPTCNDFPCRLRWIACTAVKPT